VADKRAPIALIQVFLYLQALDVLTTLIGLKLGAAEASPFVRVLMHAGPGAGLALSKCVALAIGGVCLLTGKRHLIKWITYWSAALVLWNLVIILAVRLPR